MYYTQSPLAKRALAVARWLGRHELAAIEKLAAWISVHTATKRKRIRFTLGVCAIAVAVCGLLMVHTAQADAPLAVCNQSGGTPGPVDVTVNYMNGTMYSWPRQIIGALTGTFFIILAGTALWSYVDAIIGSGGQIHMLGWNIARTGFRFGLASAAFLQAPVWAPGIIDGVLQTLDSATGGGGLHASAWQAVQPGDVFMHGACIAGTMMHATDNYNIVTDGLKAVSGGIVVGVSAIFTVIFYAIVMLSIVLVRIETPIVLAVGAVLCLGFAAPDLFMGLPMKYIGTLVGLGGKIGALSLLVSVIDNASATWVSVIQSSAASPINDLIILGSMACLCVAAFFVPMVVGTLGGAPAMVLGSAVSSFNSLHSTVQNIMPKSSGGGGGGGGSSNSNSNGSTRSNSSNNSNQPSPQRNTLTAP